MSATAPKVNSDTDSHTIPSLVGIWELEIDPNPSLSPTLTTIQITFQKHGENSDLIFGYVNSSPPRMSSYALRDGQVTNELKVFFVVRISGVDYTFNGDVGDGGQTLTGIPLDAIEDGTADPGNWSAQAQSGG
jgi:hypothetical protein